MGLQYQHLIENSLATFAKQFMDPKVDGIELDVQLTKDNKVVVFHDKTTERIFRNIKPPKTITEILFSDLPADIPLLVDVLKHPFRRKDVLVDIELKLYDDDQSDILLKHVRKVCVECGPCAKPYVFSSFCSRLFSKPEVIPLDILAGGIVDKNMFLEADDVSTVRGIYTLCESYSLTDIDKKVLEKINEIKSQEPFYVITNDVDATVEFFS